MLVNGINYLPVSLNIISRGKWLLYWVLIVVAFLLTACASELSPVKEETSLGVLPCANQLQNAIDGSLAEIQGKYELGISAAVIVPGYETWWGVSGNSQSGVPITEEMLFDAGSIQKNFEAALALRLVDEDRLSLDDPISKYLPPYTNVDGNITVRQLLNHSSGIFNVFEHPDFPWVGSGVDYSRNWKIEDVFNQFVLEPYGKPGTVQHYSSTNYLLLTAILEKVSGSSVPDLIDQHFLKPMKLTHTFVSMGDPPPAKYAVAHPWVDYDRDGVLDDLFGIPQTWKVTLTHPVMYSTPIDLVHWMHALYHERSVLEPRLLTEMLTYPEVAEHDPEGGIYGLGVLYNPDILRVEIIGHGGSALGYSAAALYMPEYGVSVAWMINTGENPYQLASQLMEATWSAISKVIVRSFG